VQFQDAETGENVLTRQAIKTCLNYLSETNGELHFFLHNYLADNPLPLSGDSDADAWLATLASTPLTGAGPAAQLNCFSSSCSSSHARRTGSQPKVCLLLQRSTASSACHRKGTGHMVQRLMACALQRPSSHSSHYCSKTSINRPQ